MLNKNWKKNFLWGASTSAYQVEGAYNVDGKGLNIHDVIEAKENVCSFNICSDHYNKWKEDIKLMSELGLKSYRFSISWTRIFPTGKDKVNQKGVNFYNNLINELLKYNIEPIVTIYHFDTPLELEKQGGWSNKKLMIDAYCKYAETLFELFGDRVKYWLTINELNMMVLYGHVLSAKKINDAEDKFKVLFQEAHNMFVAQAHVINLLHTKFAYQNSFIGPAPNIAPVYAVDSNPKNIDAAYKTSALRNWMYLDIVVYGEYNKLVWNWLVEKKYEPEIEKNDMVIIKKGKPDFIAFNYYDTMTVAADNNEIKINFEGFDQQNPYDMPGLYKVVKNKYLERTQFGWEIDPDGFKQCCRELYDRYRLPLLLTENGIGGKDSLTEDLKIHDQYRIDYYEQHIKLIPEIIDEGIPLFGYQPWSAIDLVSTHEGMKKRYGFVYVDKDDQENGTMMRYKKDSFYWYQKTIKNNGGIK